MIRCEQARAAQAADYADDILLCKSLRARENAERNGIPLTIVLRVLVPFWHDRGLNARDMAVWLGVSDRTVWRHLKRVA